MSIYNYIYHLKVTFLEVVKGFFSPTKSNDGDPGMRSELARRRQINPWGVGSTILVSTIFMGIMDLFVCDFRKYSQVLIFFVYLYVNLN